MRFTIELLEELDEISATTTPCITFTTTNNNNNDDEKDKKHKAIPSNTTNSTSVIMNPNDKIPKEKLEPKNVKLGFHIASSSSSS